MAQMPDPSKKEHPSTYMVQDRSSQEELLRLDEQDRMLNTMMNGVLPEQTDPTQFQSVLDVGCGAGGWLVQAAQTYPTIQRLWGVDISAKMIEYASARAEAAQITSRVSFKVGDALRMLEFPTNTFDLVNQRLGMSFLRKWDWPNILREYQRVCKPEGTIRITEAGMTAETNSPALTRIGVLVQNAFYNAGHSFANEPDGVIAHFAQHMEKHGVVDVQTRWYKFDYHSDPQALKYFAHDAQRGARTLIPFFRKWLDFPSDYEELYQQMVQETNDPGFRATHTTVTAWGINRVNKPVNRS